MNKILEKHGLQPAWLITAEDNLKRLTVKHILHGHLKIDKTKVLIAKGSLMKVESIAECSPWSGTFCNTYACSLENQFLVFFLSGRLRLALLYSETADQNPKYLAERNTMYLSTKVA